MGERDSLKEQKTQHQLAKEEEEEEEYYIPKASVSLDTAVQPSRNTHREINLVIYK